MNLVCPLSMAKAIDKSGNLDKHFVEQHTTATAEQLAGQIIASRNDVIEFFLSLLVDFESYSVAKLTRLTAELDYIDF